MMGVYMGFVGNDARTNKRQALLPNDGIGNSLRVSIRDIQRPIIEGSHSCIVLSEKVRNYELKGIHFNMLL